MPSRETRWRNWGDHPVVVAVGLFCALMAVLIGILQYWSAGSGSGRAIGETTINTSRAPNTVGPALSDDRGPLAVKRTEASPSDDALKSEQSSGNKDRFGPVEFVLPAGWTRVRAPSGLALVPAGELPPDYPYGGVRSAGIVIGDPLRFAEDGTDMRLAIVASLEQDRGVIQRSPVRNLKSNQQGVEAFAITVTYKRGNLVVLTDTVTIHRYGAAVQIAYAAVNDFLYKRYYPEFDRLLATVKLIEE